MDNVWIIVIAVGVVIWLIVKFLGRSRPVITESTQVLPDVSYSKKPLLTKSERAFMEKLRPLGEYDLIIVPQVNLATIINKISTGRYHNELFRNVDFGIFDTSYNILLLVELNDPTHQQKSRKYRDYKVRTIAEQAGIPLVTFYTDKPNDQNYVLHRITEKLKEHHAPQN